MEARTFLLQIQSLEIDTSKLDMDTCFAIPIRMFKQKTVKAREGRDEARRAEFAVSSVQIKS